MKRDKILFLDIDGVINTMSRSYNKELRDQARNNSSAACKQLARVLKETGCGVVVTSTWRESFPNGNVAYEIERRFKISDFVSHYIGDTPILSTDENKVPREEEIKKWIKDNQFDGRYAVIDDIDYEFDDMTEYLFVTKLETGLTKDIADRIIDFLKY